MSKPIAGEGFAWGIKVIRSEVKGSPSRAEEDAALASQVRLHFAENVKQGLPKVMPEFPWRSHVVRLSFGSGKTGNVR